MADLKIFKNEAHKLRGENPKFPLSLSIAFYNNLRCLDLMLAALENQSFQDFELVISDDGSKPEVVAEVQKKLQNLRTPTMHLWQEDRGFRKNRMLNWFIESSHSDYLVFVDQDCLPHTEFLREHFELRQKDAVLSGRRVELTPWLSKKLTPEKIRQNFIQKNYWWILPAIAFVKDSNSPKGLHFSNPTLKKYLNRKERSLLGCNFSCYKDNLLKINGFDTRYEHAGTGEDSDVEFRFKKAGVRILPVVHGPVQFHVWHKLTPTSKENESIFHEVQRQGLARTPFGLEQQKSEA